jgi:hypothetical protein
MCTIADNADKNERETEARDLPARDEIDDRRTAAERGVLASMKTLPRGWVQPSCS